MYIYTDVACICIYCKYMFRFKIPSKVDCAHELLRNQSRRTSNHVGRMKREPNLWGAGIYMVPRFEFSVLFYMLHNVPECLWYFLNFIWLKNIFLHNMIILFMLKFILLIISQIISWNDTIFVRKIILKLILVGSNVILELKKFRNCFPVVSLFSS